MAAGGAVPPRLRARPGRGRSRGRAPRVVVRELHDAGHAVEVGAPAHVAGERAPSSSRRVLRAPGTNGPAPASVDAPVTAAAAAARGASGAGTGATCRSTTRTASGAERPGGRRGARAERAPPASSLRPGAAAGDGRAGTGGASARRPRGHRGVVVEAAVRCEGAASTPVLPRRSPRPREGGLDGAARGTRTSVSWMSARDRAVERRPSRRRGGPPRDTEARPIVTRRRSGDPSAPRAPQQDGRAKETPRAGPRPADLEREQGGDAARLRRRNHARAATRGACGQRAARRRRSGAAPARRAATAGRGQQRVARPGGAPGASPPGVPARGAATQEPTGVRSAGGGPPVSGACRPP
jgi:hypothetical protein